MQFTLQTHRTLAALALGFTIASFGGCTAPDSPPSPTVEHHSSTEGRNRLSDEAAQAIATSTVHGIEQHVIPAVEKLNAEKLRGQARSELSSIGSKAQIYAIRHGGDYPTNLEQLDPAPASDPYGNAYVFKLSPDYGFELWCLGADGKLDGQGFDADFSYLMVINGQR
ncbi:MAG: hypothetical protein JKY61_06555 [Planctomycetes bacterium]|nr:hypothetical protein [Planctomycetota bacterium]